MDYGFSLAIVMEFAKAGSLQDIFKKWNDPPKKFGDNKAVVIEWRFAKYCKLITSDKDLLKKVS